MFSGVRAGVSEVLLAFFMEIWLLRFQISGTFSKEEERDDSLPRSAPFT